MKPMSGLIVILAFLGLVTLWDMLFVVAEHQQALVLQFGAYQRTLTAPGLYMKVPFMQSVVFYEKRLLDLDLPPEEVPTADQKRIVVDTFTRYKIVDPLLYYKAVGNELNTRVRLQNIVTSSIRRILGRETLMGLLSPQRSRIMGDIQAQVNEAAQPLGIEVVDVRIRRADLPQENSAAVFERMRTEREREAKEFRARGQEEAQITRVNADREARVLKAEAERDAQILRGEGDQQSIRVTAAAYGKDKEFYTFYRALEAYKKALGDPEKTTMMLSTDHPFFKILQTGGRA